MAMYSLIRGWLECSFEDVERVQNLVAQHWLKSDQYQINADTAQLYKTAWVFPKAPINWLSLIFFGANLNERSIPFIFDCLSEIAKSGLEIDGYFHVDDEEGQSRRLWTIEHGELLDVPR